MGRRLVESDKKEGAVATITMASTTREYIETRESLGPMVRLQGVGIERRGYAHIAGRNVICRAKGSGGAGF